MSWATCYAGSNNIHFDFPPIMMDGRNYATWQPGSKVSDDIKKREGINSNWKYRQYMTNNAESIIKQNQINACNICCACSSKYGAKHGSDNNTPYLYKSNDDTKKPFGYQDSDLKNTYLSRFDLQSRIYTPVMSQDQLLNNGFKNFN